MVLKLAPFHQKKSPQIPELYIYIKIAEIYSISSNDVVEIKIKMPYFTAEHFKGYSSPSNPLICFMSQVTWTIFTKLLTGALIQDLRCRNFFWHKKFKCTNISLRILHQSYFFYRLVFMNKSPRDQCKIHLARGKTFLLTAVWWGYAVSGSWVATLNCSKRWGARKEAEGLMCQTEKLVRTPGSSCYWT